MEPHHRTGTLAFRLELHADGTRTGRLLGRDFTAVSKCAEGINK